MGNFIQRLERICCVLLFFLLVYLFYFHFVVISCHCPYLEDVHFGTFSLLISDDYTLHGPIFIQEPSHVMFPLDSEEKKVKLTCEVKGNPKPHIRFVNLKACVLTRILSVIKQQILMECWLHKELLDRHHRISWDAQDRLVLMKSLVPSFCFWQYQELNILIDYLTASLNIT